MRVIFVCTGNTCRSPMAEKIFADMTKDDGVEVESRGVMCRKGAPMALNAAMVMHDMHLSTEHESTPLSESDIKDADYIITMTAGHKAVIEEMLGKSDNVVTLDSLTHGGDIPDPYGMDINVYRATAAKIKEELTKLKEIIVNNGKKDK